MTQSKLAKEMPCLTAHAQRIADDAGLAQTIYWTTDPLAPYGTAEATNPRPRIAREGYRMVPVLSILPTRYFVA